MSALLFLLLILTGICYADMQQQYDDAEPQPVPIDGRSFFFLGTLFRRWRDRWLAYNNPAPMYAGAAFPINGYFNCPAYGCNPASIRPQPGYYPAYYATPLQQQQQQQQQQAQGNSNVYIYQTDQNSVSSSSMPPPPYGPGYFGPMRPPAPLGPPLPPPPLPPPALMPLPGPPPPTALWQ